MLDPLSAPAESFEKGAYLYGICSKDKCLLDRPALVDFFFEDCREEDKFLEFRSIFSDFSLE